MAKSGKEKAAAQEKRARSALKRQFKRFDKNGDGYIAGEEIDKFLAALNVSTDPAFRRAFLKHADKNKDGKISFKEFEEVTAKVAAKVEKKEEETLKTFKTFDRDGNGYIEGGELKSLVKSLKETTTFKSRREILATFDANTDGRLSYKEFRQLIKQAEEQAKEVKLAKKMFKKFDKDGNKKIDAREFHSFLHSISLATSGPQRLELRKALGDEQGSFDEEAFVKVFIVSQKAAAKRDEQVRKVFKAADKDKSGQLSRKELEKILPKVGIEVSKDVLKAKLKEADADGDGELDISEFKELMFLLQRGK